MQVEQFLAAVPDEPGHPLHLRDRAMLELLYASGLRISELTGARLENLNLEQGMIRVTGKGQKTRLVPVGTKAREAIARTSPTGSPEAGQAAHEQRTFSFQPGPQARTTVRVYAIVKRIAARSGLEQNVYPASAAA